MIIEHVEDGTIYSSDVSNIHIAGDVCVCVFRCLFELLARRQLRQTQKQRSDLHSAVKASMLRNSDIFSIC